MITVVATLFTTDPNENGEGEFLTISSSGGEISGNVAAYNMSTSFSYQAVNPNEVITGVLEGFDGDESCTITATVNPAPAFTPQQKHTAAQASLGTGLASVTAGAAFAILCASGAGTPLCAGLLALGSLSGAGSLTLGYISSDPPDSNYMQIATPVIGTIPQVQPGSGLTAAEASAFNAVFNIDAQIYGVGMAAYISGNRAQGAKNANNSFWEQRQLNAAEQYNKMLGQLLSQDLVARTNLSQLLQAAGVTATITPAEILAEEQEIAANGLPTQVTAQLSALGLSSAQIQQLAQMLFAQDANAASGSFPSILVSQGYVSAITAAAEAFQGAATSCMIAPSSNLFTSNDPTTLTAVVAVPPGNGSPTGTVTFVDSADSYFTLGTAKLTGGVASISVQLHAPPDRQWIAAVYSGDNTFKGCTSNYIPEDYSH